MTDAEAKAVSDRILGTLHQYINNVENVALAMRAHAVDWDELDRAIERLEWCASHRPEKRDAA